MWCMFAAPLLMSNDLRSIDKKTVAMLTNREVIAIDQDALGASAEGTLIVNNTNIMSAQVSVWHKPLANGDVAVALLNMGVFDASTYNLTYTAAMLGLDDAASYKVRDLWTAQDAGVFRGSQSVWLEPAEVLMLRFSKSTAHENEPRRKILKTDDISAFEAFEREAAKPSPPHGGCNELSPALGSHMVLQQAPAAAVLFGTVCGKLAGVPSIRISVDGALAKTHVLPKSGQWTAALAPLKGEDVALAAPAARAVACAAALGDARAGARADALSRHLCTGSLKPHKIEIVAGGSWRVTLTDVHRDPCCGLFK